MNDMDRELLKAAIEKIKIYEDMRLNVKEALRDSLYAPEFRVNKSLLIIKIATRKLEKLED